MVRKAAKTRHFRPCKSPERHLLLNGPLLVPGQTVAWDLLALRILGEKKNEVKIHKTFFFFFFVPKSKDNRGHRQCSCRYSYMHQPASWDLPPCLLFGQQGADSSSHCDESAAEVSNKQQLAQYAGGLRRIRSERP